MVRSIQFKIIVVFFLIGIIVITGLGLVDAKGLVDKVPAEIKKDIPAEEGAKIKEQLEAAGATVEVK